MVVPFRSPSSPPPASLQNRWVVAILLLATLACEEPFQIEGPLEDPLNLAPLPATHPEPVNGQAGVALEPQLSWRGEGDPDGDAVVYDIYLGLAEPLLRIGTTSDSTLTVPIRLGPDTEFLWRVVTSDGGGRSAESDTWTFRTTIDPQPNLNDPPAPITEPSPRNGAADVPIEIDLGWQGGGDPEGLETVYEVFLAVWPGLPVSIGFTRDLSFDLSRLGPDLTHGAMYTWRIEARDPEGLAALSPMWSFTTAPRLNSPPPAPLDPSPADGASSVVPEVILSWDSGEDADGDSLTFAVYFGTSDPPPFAGAQSGASYDPPGDLEFETTYYWQVVATDNWGGEVPGPVWSFLTGAEPNSPPTSPSNPDPPSGAVGVSRDIVLTWSGGQDPDGDLVNFDIYFGISDPPPLAASRWAASYDPPGDLDSVTSYYWRIVARDGEGGEASSGTLQFTTAP
jgi:hypothetical protein